MPAPNLTAANADGLEGFVLESYSAQLFLRKHLNRLHSMFYRPENGMSGCCLSSKQACNHVLTIISRVGPESFSANAAKYFATIDALEESLKSTHVYAPNMVWEEDDPPATDILSARLRGKYYGAKVITYRHFVLKILENSSKSISIEGEQVSNEFKNNIDVPRISKDNNSRDAEKVLKYTRDCISALVKSTTAFHGLPESQRLIVTNVWGTAHA